MEEIVQSIHNIIASHTEQHVNSDSHMFLDLEIDSMNAIKIATELEGEFNIEITGFEMAHWDRVHDVVNCVMPKIKD